MISLRVCLPSKFNLTCLLVGIFHKTTAALCKQMSITTDLIDFPQKSDWSFFIVERFRSVASFICRTRHLVRVYRMPYKNLNKNEKYHLGADPGFLERRYICIMMWGFALLILSHFS